MKLFTTNQLRVIDKIWIPILLAAALAAGYIVLRNYGDIMSYSSGYGTRLFSNFRGPLIIFLPILYLTYNLEFFILENRHRFSIAIASFILLGGAWGYFEKVSTTALSITKSEIITALLLFVLLLMRNFAYEKKDKNNAIVAIAMAAVFTIIPYSESVFNFMLQRFLYQESGFAEFVYGNLLVPVIYYLILFIGDNVSDVLSGKDYINTIRSKLTVMDKRTYLFLFIGLYSLMLPAGKVCAHIFALGGMREIQKFFVSDVFVLIRFLFSLGVILLVPLILKNIIVARSLTINSPGKIWFLLHFIPVVNIIPVIRSFSAPDVHASAGENGVSYMKQPMSVLRYVMTGLGVAILVYQMIILDATMNNDISIFYALAFIRIILYIVIFKKEFPAFLLPAISVAIVIFSRDFGVVFGGITIMMEAFAVQYLLEIYHPSLEDADAEIYLKEETAIGEDLVVDMN
ncbi:hypothetical protein ACE38W_10395 [Chitinophaga sp. Hz27]|uniref:hypothetical protein n=1 Tax=Chitinophaga sp. Hz27 TaxID=3347169 RepID=UPI0035D80A2F